MAVSCQICSRDTSKTSFESFLPHPPRLHMRQPVRRVFQRAGFSVERGAAGGGSGAGGSRLGGVAGEGGVAGLERVVGEQAEGHGLGLSLGGLRFPEPVHPELACPRGGGDRRTVLFFAGAWPQEELSFDRLRTGGFLLVGSRSRGVPLHHPAGLPLHHASRGPPPPVGEDLGYAPSSGAPRARGGVCWWAARSRARDSS